MLPSATLGQQESGGHQPNLKTDCRVALSGFKGTEAVKKCAFGRKV